MCEMRVCLVAGLAAIQLIRKCEKIWYVEAHRPVGMRLHRNGHSIGNRLGQNSCQVDAGV